MLRQVQSEGFVASVFYLWLMRGSGTPGEDVIQARTERTLRAMDAMFASTKMTDDTPWLLAWVASYMKLFPDEKAALADAITDLSHGVFVDAQARSMWRDHYLAALRLDRNGMNVPGLVAARKKWREQVIANPEALMSRLAPQLRCEVKSVSVKLEALGEAGPLVFDINTAPEGMLRLIPSLKEKQVLAWLQGQPFASRESLATALGTQPCIP